MVVEKQKEKELVIKQQKITTINFLGKTLNQIIQEIGDPTLIRKDGNTQTVRFDSNNCRLFIYYKLNIEQPRAEHYEIRNIKGKIKFKSNNSGGILGGISSGQEIIASFTVKPTSSILITRETIDTKGKNTKISVKGRHDPCVGIRAVPIGEAMMACVLLDHFLLNRAHCG